MNDPDSLLATKLTPSLFLPRLRKVESIAESVEYSVLIYCSVRSAGRFLPRGPRFRELMRDISCLSIFSFVYDSEPDDSTVFVFSSDGSLFIDFNQIPDELKTYWCSGCLGFKQTQSKFDSLIEKFQALDEKEAERVKEAVDKLKSRTRKESIAFRTFLHNWNSYADGM
tara:strand:+ start:86 stop:592 length:507 start_codon:yes stop_codon:yes gene_type:complete